MYLVRARSRGVVGLVTAIALVAAMLTLVPGASGSEPKCDPKTEKCDDGATTTTKPGSSTSSSTSSSSTSSSSTSSSTTSSSTTSSSTTSTTTPPPDNNAPELACPILASPTPTDPVGTVLGVASGSDADGDALTYSGGDPDGIIGVANDGTVALTDTVANREVSISVTIVASDGTDATEVVCDVTVTVVSAAETARTYGSRTAGHVVYTAPEDIRALGPLTVVSGNDEGLFSLDGQTGAVTVVDTLPRPDLHTLGADREQTYDMEIEAGTPDGVIELTLTILVVDFFDDDHVGDVSSSPYENSINWMGDSAVDPWLRPVTSGCTSPDKIAPVYCPENGTLRGQMAVFVTRMAMVVDEAAAWDNSDVDVIEWSDTVGHRFSRWIVAMREAGFTDGCNQGTGFCPERVITWGEASVFIMRAFGPTIDGSDGLGVSQPEALQWVIDSGLTSDLLAADQPTASDVNADVLRGVMARVLHTVGTTIGAPTPG